MIRKCSVCAACGGCRYTGTEYSAQLAAKQRRMEQLLGKFCRVEPIVGMEDPYCYRNKVHHVFAETRAGLISGCYAEGTHRVVKVEECLIEDRKCQQIIATVEKLCKSFKIRAYNEDTGYGLIRHVLVRRGFQSGEILVVLVMGSPLLPGKNNFLKALLAEHPDITTVVMNLNSQQTSMVLGPSEKTLYGLGFIKDQLCGNTFRISPDSFYQVNPVQTEKLYSTAVELAGLTGRETVLDAYCGIGTIGLCAAGKAKKVIGVELNAAAVRDARINARENRISNAVFYQADATEWISKCGEKIDTVFMDPPRSGSTPLFIRSAAALSPGRIVYISCGPDTLERDLREFEKQGYRAQYIRPFDMFPFTDHIETVCLLVLRNPVTHINIDVDVEELVQDKRGQATYEQIREYVKEQTGLHVTNLNIAQTKRKCGIIEREKYNLPKTEDSRQPNCTKEKEEAIKEAFRHFGMI